MTLALTHYNRFPLLQECFKQVIDDPRIGEIIISDDCSTDGSIEELRKHYTDHPKVRLWINPSNIDCYRNKRRAVSHATNDWVILFDSDNVITQEYLDALFALPVWRADTIYTPEWAQPHFDFRSFAGVTASKENVAKHMKRPHFSTMLNAANYFFFKRNWIGVWKGDVDPHTSDSIYQIYNWMNAGGRLHVVPDLQYFHRIHAGSHYKNNCHKTGRFAKEVEEKLLALE